MDTERPIINNERCLDHYFEKPFVVAGDVRAIFYDTNGGRLFYACFNTYFISHGLLQFSQGDLDKVGRRGRSICGPCFCVELLFGPMDPHLPVADGHGQVNLDICF